MGTFLFYKGGKGMLKINHIYKSFGNNEILHDVSLDVKKGDVYGILGLSGAGKSTLVRCINGLETVDSGEILYKDEVICSNSIKISKEKLSKISMIFQSFNLLEQKNVIENIDLALTFSNTKKNVDKSKIKELKEKYSTLIKNDKQNKKALKQELKLNIAKVKYEKAFKMLENVGLVDKWDSYPSRLSGGQKQRVAIARALMNDPEILLCDEATSALDPDTTSSILSLLKHLNKTLGLTILIISHQMSVVEEICNKVAVIDKSRIVEQGNMSEIFLNPKTDITKKLIYSSKLTTKLSDDNTLRILFDGNIDEPLIANIIQDCNILVSIVYADSKVIDGKVYGQLVLKLPEKTKDIDKLKKYLDFKNVKYEEVRKDD